MEPEQLQKYHAGDHKTFNRIMAEYQEPIYFFLLRMVGNEEDAQDLTQETFVKTYTERKKFKGNSAVNTWIYRIAANLAKNHLRWRSIRNFIPVDHAGDELVNMTNDESADELEAREQELLMHLQSLSKTQRSVFILRYFNQLSHREVAQVMGVSEASSKTNFHYAVTALKDQVQGGKIS
ncbi:MAG: RNA polymerase sigma factor [Candidatus Marinimicrobia bacterium]|nr:RNA polymerase sigma factor [Candidatus Neomarinimicrobiota bacterium]MCF7828949.1 RNA polymerase sigma factor [Candidatus Neomarinimicrobiota bacterium]MCF7879909.1 RNA polymerase sigma factor [Candidatus Neomarinimicrobiota bacterium]